ncbi:MAG: transposase [Paludibacteraceae bacterium]
MSRLRDDAVLQYIHCGQATGKKGRPRKFDGKINPCQLDMNYFTLTVSTDQLKVYSAIVYSKAFEREINPAVAGFYKNGKEIAGKLYFSTDLKMEAEKIVSYYRSRFQIEFLYRDAKQYCGLSNSQARSENKLNFHFNAALTAVNIAKIEWLNTKTNKDDQFSMSDYKTMYNNKLLLNTFIRKFGINTNSKKNKQRIKELRLWAKIAA